MLFYFTYENMEMIKAFLYIDSLTQSQKANQVQFITNSFILLYISLKVIFFCIYFEFKVKF